jgi:hypothetical protein
MHNVEITGLSRVKEPKENKGGSTILAYFDCEVAGFRLAGCAFVRTTKNGLTIWMPKLDGPEAHRRSVAITDHSIHHAIMLEARETYRKLGGTDAEWVGRCIPQGPRTDWGTDLEVPIGIIPRPEHLELPVPFVPKRRGDVGYDGFPLTRDLTDEEAEAGMARFLEKHSLAQPKGEGQDDG